MHSSNASPSDATDGCSGSTDDPHRDDRLQIEKDKEQIADGPADDVDQEHFRCADMVGDQRTENIQSPHIEKEMPEIPVQECGSENLPDVSTPE